MYVACNKQYVLNCNTKQENHLISWRIKSIFLIFFMHTYLLIECTQKYIWHYRALCSLAYRVIYLQSGRCKAGSFHLITRLATLSSFSHLRRCDRIFCYLNIHGWRVLPIHHQHRLNHKWFLEISSRTYLVFSHYY